jgi:alkanesulfonate monooxygenase SsuD/methylene tetrahydromethanopterin reductase-like flavin-dependent oxidoreductase (luciferase family)
MPGPLAIAVAQVDAMSNGRVEFGLGAGWFEEEHSAYAIPFAPVSERFDRLEEQLQVITGLWETPVGQTYDFAGKHYQVSNSPGLPKPVQSPRPPVIVGGAGPRRTPELAARFADEYNTSFVKMEAVAGLIQRVREACAVIGRSEMPVFSAPAVTCIGRNDAEVRHRAEVLRRDVDEMRAGGGIVGTVAEAVDAIGRYGAAGVERMFLQMNDMSDLDQIELIAAEVAPQL